MLAISLLKAHGASHPQTGLSKGDIEAAVWPRLKGAKALGVSPNYWDIHLASSDVAKVGMDSVRELCAAAISDMMAREGLDCEGVTIICGASGSLESGRVKASCGKADGRKLAILVASARAAGMEVLGHADSLVVTSMWDGMSVPAPEVLTIGRDPSSDIVADVHGVSRRHGQVINDGFGRLYYIDRSTNGSIVDGVYVHGASASLHSGSRIGIAPGTFLVLSNQEHAID